MKRTLDTATAPVQAITGIACSYVPKDVAACDHLEEIVFPAETLGKHYFVTVPTSHHGSASTCPRSPSLRRSDPLRAPATELLDALARPAVPEGGALLDQGRLMGALDP